MHASGGGGGFYGTLTHWGGRKLGLLTLRKGGGGVAERNKTAVVTNNVTCRQAAPRKPSAVTTPVAPSWQSLDGDSRHRRLLPRTPRAGVMSPSGNAGQGKEDRRVSVLPTLDWFLLLLLRLPSDNVQHEFQR